MLLSPTKCGALPHPSVLVAPLACEVSIDRRGRDRRRVHWRRDPRRDEAGPYREAAELLAHATCVNAHAEIAARLPRVSCSGTSTTGSTTGSGATGAGRVGGRFKCPSASVNFARKFSINCLRSFPRLLGSRRGLGAFSSALSGYVAPRFGAAVPSSRSARRLRFASVLYVCASEGPSGDPHSHLGDQVGTPLSYSTTSANGFGTTPRSRIPGTQRRRVLVAHRAACASSVATSAASCSSTAAAASRFASPSPATRERATRRRPARQRRAFQRARSSGSLARVVARARFRRRRLRRPSQDQRREVGGMFDQVSQ